MTQINTIAARIWWDDQDQSNEGWAWTTRVDGEHDDSGPLDGCEDEADDADLIAALRSQVLTAQANEMLTDDAIKVVR